MRLSILISSILAPCSLAFAPSTQSSRLDTAVEAVSRRDALISGASALLVGLTAVPKPTLAFSQQLEYWEVEPAQMPTGGKFDLNSAFVVSNFFAFMSILWESNISNALSFSPFICIFFYVQNHNDVGRLQTTKGMCQSILLYIH